MGEWRGPDALNNDDLAKQFWEAVSRPAEPNDVKVGDIVTMEVTKGGKVSHRRTVRITEHMTSPTGEPQVRFEYVDQDPTSDVTLVIEQQP